MDIAGFIKDWVTRVVVTVIFMVLVDMVLPNNNFKKYAKIATGLIVMITILSPVFRLFDSGINIEQKIQTYIYAFENDKTNFDRMAAEKEFNEKTIEAYKEKLKNSIEQSLYNKTGKKYSVQNMDINEDTESINFSEIKYMELRQNSQEEGIKPVEKVTIGKQVSNLEAPKDKGILEVLKSEFNVNPEVVKFVK
jgi:stage III sporulation protein AF